MGNGGRGIILKMIVTCKVVFDAKRMYAFIVDLCSDLNSQLIG